MSSLWCLTCRGSRRRDSDPGSEHPNCLWIQHCCIGMEKNWSVNITPPPYKYLRSESSVGSPISPRKGHRKAYSISEPMPIISGEGNSKSEGLNFTRRGGHRKAYSISEAVMAAEEEDEMGGPRLLRSGGMRRDWSFEDLRKRVLTRDR